MKLNLVGLDPSLSNWGVSLATYNTQTQHLDIHSGFVIKTRPSKTKQSKNKQDLERALQLYQGLFTVISKATVWTAELPTGSQSSRAMTSYGICLGVVASLKTHNPSLITFNPLDVKKQVGSFSASKDEVIAWVLANYPNVKTWLPKAKNQAEHICDSIVVLHLLINHPKFKEFVMKIVLDKTELETLVADELSNQGMDLTNKTLVMTFNDGVEINISTDSKPKRKPRKTKQEKEETQVAEPEIQEEPEPEDDFISEEVEPSDDLDFVEEDSDDLDNSVFG